MILLTTVVTITSNYTSLSTNDLVAKLTNQFQWTRYNIIT